VVSAWPEPPNAKSAGVPGGVEGRFAVGGAEIDRTGRGAFGPKMDHLMRMQLANDLAQARKREKALKVKRYRRRVAA
jgi:plasmid maintenance system antidote protein VapI